MTAVETAKLALCADKYKIPRLVQEALEKLKPKSAEDVFPALICVTYANFPDLQFQVCKIIQQETDKVVESADFLKLDEASVLFILKQDTLKIDEVELWQHVVRWAERQVEMNPALTMGDCLEKILGYVRFLTFTSEEILEHVLPTEALSSDEFVDLALAVSKKQELQSPVLCNVKVKRAKPIYQQREEVKLVNSPLPEEQTSLSPKKCYVRLKRVRPEVNDLHIQPVKKHKSLPFKYPCIFRASDHFQVESRNNIRRTGNLNPYSTIKLTPNKSIKIESFTCKRNRKKKPKESMKQSFKCEITITVENLEDLDTFQDSRFKQVILVEGEVRNDDIILPLKFLSGKKIVMNPDEEWQFDLWWEENQPAYDLLATNDTWGPVIVTGTPIDSKDMTVEYRNEFHVVEIAYKTQLSY